MEKNKSRYFVFGIVCTIFIFISQYDIIDGKPNIAVARAESKDLSFLKVGKTYKFEDFSSRGGTYVIVKIENNGWVQVKDRPEATETFWINANQACYISGGK